MAESAGISWGVRTRDLHPGPDTALTIRNSIIGGRRGGLLTAGGIAAGQLIWTIAASVGLAGLLQASQPAFTALKIIGAAYSGVSRSAVSVAAVRGHPAHDEQQSRPHQLSPWNAMRQGLISNLANPKMAVFFLSLLPQFASPTSAGFAAFAPLGLVFCLMTFGWLSIYALVLHRVGSFIQRSWCGALLKPLPAPCWLGWVSGCATETRG